MTDVVRNSYKFIMTGGESTSDIEITGGRIFYTFPFEIPILGEIPDNGDSGCKLAGYAVDHRTLYLADP